MARSDSAPKLSIGCVQFEFYLPLPMAVGVALSGVEISMGDWVVGAASASTDGAVLPTLSVGMACENAGSSWCKMPCHSPGAASVATILCFPRFFVGLVSVLAISLTLDVR